MGPLHIYHFVCQGICDAFFDYMLLAIMSLVYSTPKIQSNRVVAALVTCAFCAAIYILASGMQGHELIAHIFICFPGAYVIRFLIICFGHYVTGLFTHTHTHTHTQTG